MSAIHTADWFMLDSYYRKLEIYPTMNWVIEEGLDSMMVAGSPFGGPIAVVRDRRQVVKIQTQIKPVISIYNCIGNIISKFVWNSGPLVTFGWSDQEDLMCVTEGGDVLVYDMFGEYKRSFSLGPKAKDAKVSKALFFQGLNRVCLAIITSNNQMFLVSNLNDPKVKGLPDIPRPSEPVTSWCVLAASETVTSLLLCRDKDIYLCKPGEVILMKPKIQDYFTQIVAVVVSQNGKNLALFTDSGILWMGSSDLRDTYCEIDTGHLRSPKQLTWCGNQAVAGNWANVLEMYSITGKNESIPYDGPIHLVAECDCMRVISDSKHELVQKVPKIVDNIFRLNSIAPASYLLDASRQFQKRSHSADEYLRLVQPDLRIAVQDCIDAACFEFDPIVQKMLIRAAYFGKGFIEDPIHTEHYVNTCRWLRVLNALRDPKVAIPLTYIQAQALGPAVLLDRLIWRRLHCLASHIATYLGIPNGQNRVLTHWACYKVGQPHVDNETAAREIANKLQDVPGISYTTIAKHAAAEGRKALAIKIVENEACARHQVPLLLNLGEGEKALQRAQASGDTDLVYVVLLHLKSKMQMRELERCIRSFPLAQSLYIQYCRRHDPAAYRAVLEQNDDWRAQAECRVREALMKPPPAENAVLVEAAEFCRRKKDILSGSIIDDYAKLTKQQSSLIERYGEEFRGLSVHDTAEKLLLKGEIKLADKLRSEYKIPERRYYWLRVQTLAATDNWAELEKFSKSKKSLIGYEPYVDICIKCDKRHEALKYLPRCREEIKIKYYVKAEFYREAAKVAFEQRNKDALRFVQGKCPTDQYSTHEKIAALLEQFK